MQSDLYQYDVLAAFFLFLWREGHPTNGIAVMKLGDVRPSASLPWIFSRLYRYLTSKTNTKTRKYAHSPQKKKQTNKQTQIKRIF